MNHWLIAAGVLLWVRRLLAQDSKVSCSSTFDWAKNAKGQDPCLVAAMLQADCRNDKTTTMPLAPNEVYVGPISNQNKTDNLCLCNTVVYSLLSVCAACQDRPFIDWILWSRHCDISYASTFPKEISLDIQIPAWAFGSVPASNCTRLELDAAMSTALLGKSHPSAGANMLPTMPGPVTTTLPTPSAPTRSTSADSPTGNNPAAATAAAGDNSPNPKETTNVHSGVIIGSVIGTVGAAAILILGIYLLVPRLRRGSSSDGASSQTTSYQRIMDVKIPDDPPPRRTLKTQNSNTTFPSGSVEMDIASRVASAQGQNQSAISLPSELYRTSPVEELYSPAAQSSGIFGGGYSESHYSAGHYTFSSPQGSGLGHLVPNRGRNTRGDTLHSLQFQTPIIQEEPGPPPRNATA